jgi:hypothetical protein
MGMGLNGFITKKLNYNYNIKEKNKSWEPFKICLLKTVAFIAGKSENQAAKKKFIRFSIDNLIANISLYASSWPKLNFGSFEIIFKL